MVETIISSAESEAASTRLLKVAMSPCALRTRNSKSRPNCSPARLNPANTPSRATSTFGVSTYSMSSSFALRPSGLAGRAGSELLAVERGLVEALAFSRAASSITFLGNWMPSFAAAPGSNQRAFSATFSSGMFAGFSPSRTRAIGVAAAYPGR